MLYTIIKAAKWVCVPLLLAGGPFTRTAGRYELLLSVAVCLLSAIAVGMALRKKEYLLAVGFASVAVVFSPFLLVTRIFMLLSFASIVTFVTLFAAFRPSAIASKDDTQT